MIVAKKFAAPGKRKMHFAVSDADEFSAELNDVSLRNIGDMPLVIARDLSEKRYVMQQPLTYDFIACANASSVNWWLYDRAVSCLKIF